MTYKRLKVSCLNCRREITTNNLSKHSNSSQCGKPYIRSEGYESRKTRRNCEKCGKICKSFTSLTQHEIRCTGLNKKPKVCSKCGASFYAPRRMFCSDVCSRSRTEEQKKKHSDSMKLAVKNNPESYLGGYNRGRVKSFICSNGFKVIGEWEKSFVEFCIENNIRIEQPNIGFSYYWNGERTYFPDFYLPDTDQWVEIKGLKTERDLAKWESMRNTHKKDLLVLGGPPSWILTNDQRFMRPLL